MLFSLFNNWRLKMAKHKKNKKEIILNTILALILLIIVILIIYKKESNTKTHLLDDIQINVAEDIDEKSEGLLKLEELQKENPDIRAYIEIEGTNISYPVVQTSDNDYYLKKNYKKEYSNDGSIFLDKDVNLELPSTNYLLYGHNNKNGTMFNDLLKYKDKEFYNKCPAIKFITNTEESEYEIIAAFYSRVYYKSEKNVFRYYYFINAKNEQEFNDYINNSKKASIYDTEKSATYGDQLLTLSTCSYHTEDGRFVVVAKKAIIQNKD